MCRWAYHYLVRNVFIAHGISVSPGIDQSSIVKPFADDVEGGKADHLTMLIVHLRSKSLNIVVSHARKDAMTCLLA